MSVWSTSTGRNSVFGAEGGPPPSTHPSIHPQPLTHLHSSTGHCFHKRFHNCQHLLVFLSYVGLARSSSVGSTICLKCHSLEMAFILRDILLGGNFSSVERNSRPRVKLQHFSLVLPWSPWLRCS